MPHTTISITDEVREDLKRCKEQTGVDMSRVLTHLYIAWRKGDVSVSTLPEGTSFRGPLNKRRR